jgi:hypothetical protein
MEDKKLSSREEIEWETANTRGRTVLNRDVQGIKKKEGKLEYDIDWEFIQKMAYRMAKSDYPIGNWKKPIDTEDLKQPIIRHFMELMLGNMEDEGDELGHLVALACNAMMLHYQLKDK